MSDIKNFAVNNNEEESIERSIRPMSFAEVIGREKEIARLKVMVNAAKKRSDALDHIIFFGPPGLGKTSIAGVVANEMSVPIHITSGPAIERQGDLAAILTGLEPNSILFIDEIHRLGRVVEEILYPAMEDKVIDIVLGKGPSAKSVRLDLNHFTLIGATTRMGRLSAPLRDRFGAIFRFDFYEYDDLAEIVMQKARIFGISLDDRCAMYIAQRSRRTPRIAIRILRRVRDYADVNNDGVISLQEVKNAIDMLEIDELGLDYLDRKILKVMYEQFDTRPVGLTTIAASVSEDVESIEEVCEPFLLQEGLLQRTPRGRIITQKGIEHLQKFLI